MYDYNYMYDSVESCHSSFDFDKSVAEVCIDPCQSNARTDIVVRRQSPVKIWGQVRDQCGCPVPNTLLRLVKVSRDRCNPCPREIAKTISDCNGMYCFEICSDGEHSCYKVYACKESLCRDHDYICCKYASNC